MKLRDIKDGMIVETEEELYFKMGDRMLSKNGWLHISEEYYDEKLRRKSENHEYDILAVYEPIEKLCFRIGSFFDKQNLHCIWQKRNFVKDMLKDGMVVKCRNGSHFMVIGDKLVGYGNGGYQSVDNYDNCLLYKKNDFEGFDIIEVYDSTLDIMELGELIYERRE